MASNASLSPSVSSSISPGWSLALGILLVIAGALALVYPVMAAVAATLYIGWFAVIAGVIALVVAIRTRSEPNLGWRIAVAVLYLVLGFMLVTNPVAGAASLALLVGAVIAASGVVEIILAFRHKPRAACCRCPDQTSREITQRGRPLMVVRSPVPVAHALPLPLSVT